MISILIIGICLGFGVFVDWKNGDTPFIKKEKGGRHAKRKNYSRS